MPKYDFNKVALTTLLKSQNTHAEVLLFLKNCFKKRISSYFLGAKSSNFVNKTVSNMLGQL